MAKTNGNQNNADQQRAEGFIQRVAGAKHYKQAEEQMAEEQMDLDVTGHRDAKAPAGDQSGYQPKPLQGSEAQRDQQFQREHAEREERLRTQFVKPAPKPPAAKGRRR